MLERKLADVPSAVAPVPQKEIEAFVRDEVEDQVTAKFESVVETEMEARVESSCNAIFTRRLTRGPTTSVEISVPG